MIHTLSLSVLLSPIFVFSPSSALVCAYTPFVLKVYRGAWCDVKLGRKKKKLYCHGNPSPSVSLWSLIHPGSENMKAVLLHRHAALDERKASGEWDNPFRLHGLHECRGGRLDGEWYKKQLCCCFMFIFNDRLLHKQLLLPVYSITVSRFHLETHNMSFKEKTTFFRI